MNYLGFIFIFFSSYIAADEGISLIVPCHYKHFYLLEELLTTYSHQTLLPDEVVISLSEAYQIPQKDIDELKNENWPFIVKIIATNEERYAGTNRNTACEHASGDILICQDADDLPHKQRVEILKFIFDHFDVDHIIHRWVGNEWSEDNVNLINYQLDKLVYHDINSVECLDSFNYIHHGNIALRQSVWEEVKWINSRIGEDYEYNQHCINLGYNTIVLEPILLIYREQYSLTDYDRID